jgi:hypothetical protein
MDGFGLRMKNGMGMARIVEARFIATLGFDRWLG